MKTNWLEKIQEKRSTVIDNIIGSFKKGGGIHIDPKNKGKFTATKEKTGETTEELTHSKNPLTRKRAIFAQNAKKWKHEDGGSIEQKDSLPVKGEQAEYKKVIGDKSTKQVVNRINIPFPGNKNNPSNFKEGGVIDYNISNILNTWKK